MSNSRTQMVIGFALVMILELFVASSECKAAPTYKVGLVTGITGPFSQHTSAGYEAYKFAIEEINAKGGILGRQIELFMRDDQYKPPVAGRVTRELILKNNVDFIFGGNSSACTLAIQQVTKEYKMLQLCAASKADRLTTVTIHPYFFQSVPSTNMDTNAIASVVAKTMKDVKTYVLLAHDYEAGHSYMNNYEDYMKKHRPDMKLLKKFPIPLTEMDFTSYISAILAEKPDMCVTFFGGDAIKNFVKQGRGYDFFKKTIFIPGQAFMDDIMDMGDQFGEGSLIISEGPFWGIDNPRLKILMEYFLKRLGRYPSDYAIVSYDAVYILYEAIKRAKSFDREAIARQLEGGRFKTLRGDLYFREIDHQLNAPVWLATSVFDKEKGFCIGKNPVKVPGEEVWYTPEEIKEIRAKAGVVFKPWKEQ